MSDCINNECINNECMNNECMNNECYKHYMKNKEQGKNWTEGIDEFIKEKNFIKEEVINSINRLVEIIELKHAIETFGIELEYAGRDTYCNQNNELTETIKYDGSVVGDGREWNLKPQKFSKLNSEEYKKALESWMVTAANHNCLMHVSAGNHIHLGTENTIEEYNNDEKAISEKMRIIGDAVKKVFYYCFSYSIRITDENENEIDRIKLNKIQGENNQENVKKCYEALQFLYSVSNRSGREHYGLGLDGTRGYTRHATVEIRAFKTTTDYRSVIARTYISKFFTEWCAKTILAYENYISWEEMPSIWEEIEKPKNEKIKNMYTYLAFNIHNKHKIGLSEEKLINKLNIEKRFAKAIKNRSSMIAKALLKNTPENKTKELFKF